MASEPCTVQLMYPALLDCRCHFCRVYQQGLCGCRQHSAVEAATAAEALQHDALPPAAASDAAVEAAPTPAAAAQLYQPLPSGSPSINLGVQLIMYCLL
jgi:hypothetical protein